MKLNSLLVIALFVVASCAHHHDHKDHKEHKEHKEHQHGEEQGITLNNGKKWETDADLKKLMGNINTELQKVKKLEKSGKAGPKTYEHFYHSIETSTQKIINSCKMPEGMHENYHVILEDILNTSEELKDAEKQKGVTAKMTETMKKYTEYFDHNLKVE